MVGLTDGGMMIDLSPMKGVRVDPAARTAWAQPGVIFSELDRETQVFGLATPGGTISRTGIAGFTLGGGVGGDKERGGPGVQPPRRRLPRAHHLDVGESGRRRPSH
jgi:FAD/FMN-containing dehydrogenase